MKLFKLTHAFKGGTSYTSQGHQGWSVTHEYFDDWEIPLWKPRDYPLLESQVNKL